MLPEKGSLCLWQPTRTKVSLRHMKTFINGEIGGFNGLQHKLVKGICGFCVSGRDSDLLIESVLFGINKTGT